MREVIAVIAIALPLTATTVAAPSICASGYAKSARHVSRAERDRVYSLHGIPRGQRRGFVIDHFMPLELGGTNDESNLVPQARSAAHRKDLDEDRLRIEVCDGEISLAAARAEIVRLWGSYRLK